MKTKHNRSTAFFKTQRIFVHSYCTDSDGAYFHSGLFTRDRFIRRFILLPQIQSMIAVLRDGKSIHKEHNIAELEKALTAIVVRKLQ